MNPTIGSTIRAWGPPLSVAILPQAIRTVLGGGLCCSRCRSGLGLKIYASSQMGYIGLRVGVPVPFNGTCPQKHAVSLSTITSQNARSPWSPEHHSPSTEPNRIPAQRRYFEML